MEKEGPGYPKSLSAMTKVFCGLHARGQYDYLVIRWKADMYLLANGKDMDEMLFMSSQSSMVVVEKVLAGRGGGVFVLEAGAVLLVGFSCGAGQQNITDAGLG